MSMAVTLLAGVSGGWIAYWAGVPGGALVGSMVAVGALRLLGAPVREVSSGMRRSAQVVIGVMLGVSFNWRDLLLGEVLLPALALSGLLLALSFFVAWVVVRRTGWPWSTALLSTAPAGMTEISISADAMGIDGSVVAVLHLVRITTVVTLVPWLVRWLG